VLQSLPRLSLDSRRVQLALGAFLLLALSGGFVKAIASENLQLGIRLCLLIASPGLVVLALRKPLFPYALYVAAVPFDNLLLVSGVGTITKMLGFAATLSLIVHIARHRRFRSPSYPLYFFCAYLGFNVLSLLWTRDPQGGIIDAQILVATIVLYTLLTIAPLSERDLRAICYCIVISGVVASIFGIYVLHNVVNTAGDSGRLMVDVGNRTIDPNHYANSLLAPLALALVALAHARTAARTIVALGAVLILGAGIEISLSREALIASFVIALVLAAFSRRRLLSLSLLATSSFLVPLIFPAIGVRMMEALSTGGAGRTSIWHIQWRSFLEHPIFGWGVGSAALAYNRNFLSVYQPYSAGWNMASHNTALHILVDCGIVGLVLAVLGIMASFYQLRGIKRGNSLYPLRAGLTAALVGVVIVSFFIDLSTYKYLWVVLTTTAQFGSVARSRSVATGIDISAVIEPRHRRRFWFARGFLVGGACIVFGLSSAGVLQWLSRRPDFEPPSAIAPVAAANLAAQARASAGKPTSIDFHRVDDAPEQGQMGFVYSSGWQHVNGLYDGRSGGTSSRTVKVGAMAKLHFDGRGLRIYGIKGAGGGRAELLIDGRKLAKLNFYAKGKEAGVLMFQILTLSSGQHIASIIVVASPSAALGHGYVNLDGAAYAE
jgi:O-antigen ligase